MRYDTFRFSVFSAIVILLIFGACRSPIAPDAPPAAISDAMADRSKMHLSPSTFSFDTSSPGQFMDDATRMHRGSATTPEFVYRLTDQDMKSLEMVTWFWVGEDIVDFDFFISIDGTNGSWIPCYPETEQSLPSPAWRRVVYSKDALPSGTRFLKIVFGKTAGVNWSPQVGSVKIY